MEVLWLWTTIGSTIIHCKFDQITYYFVSWLLVLILSGIPKELWVFIHIVWPHGELTCDIVANCNGTSQCQIHIPFRGKDLLNFGHTKTNSNQCRALLALGSGITIQGVLFSGVSNFTVSVDGKEAPAPPESLPIPLSWPPLYNITLYDIQSLPLASHAMIISIVPWNNGESEIAFDYAYVNETDPLNNLSHHSQ